MRQAGTEGTLYPEERGPAQMSLPDLQLCTGGTFRNTKKLISLRPRVGLDSVQPSRRGSPHGALSGTEVVCATP